MRYEDMTSAEMSAELKNLGLKVSVNILDVDMGSDFNRAFGKSWTS